LLAEQDKQISFILSLIILIPGFTKQVGQSNMLRLDSLVQDLLSVEPFIVILSDSLCPPQYSSAQIQTPSPLNDEKDCYACDAHEPSRSNRALGSKASALMHHCAGSC
jgi:hypothetical protein